MANYRVSTNTNNSNKKTQNKKQNNNNNNNNNKVKLLFRSENVKYVHLQRIQQIIIIIMKVMM
jgi:hypothetical protein